MRSVWWETSCRTNAKFQHCAWAPACYDRRSLSIHDDQHYMFYEGDWLVSQISEYLLGIAAAAFLCGIIAKLIGKNGTHKQIVKLLLGLLMAISVLRPLVHLNVSDLLHISDRYIATAEALSLGAYNTTIEILD